jgi:hypothetical protein
MRKQHHPATIILLLVAIIVAGVFIRKSTKLQQRLDAATVVSTGLKQRLERETNTRLGVQQELATLRRALSGQEAALHDFMQRVHVVHDAALDITIEAARAVSDAPSTVPVISVELVTADGRVWRFMNDYEQQPTVTVTGENTVRMTVRCAPVRGADIEGRPVAELGGVTRLRTPYQAVLGGAGFAVSPASTREIVLLLDGMEVVRVAPTPLAPDAWEYDVTAVFTGLYQRYQDQLRARISAAADAASPPSVQ